jgi:RHS repeat-associated protein
MPGSTAWAAARASRTAVAAEPLTDETHGMGIDVASGTVRIERSLLSVPGRIALTWDLRYSTAPGAEPGSVALGRGWTNRYSPTLTRFARGFRFVTADGAVELLADVDGVVESGGVLRHLGAFFEIFRLDDDLMVQTWNVDSGLVWRHRFRVGEPGVPQALASIEDPSGHALDLVWDADGRLARVRQRAEGRELRMQYGPTGFLEQVGLAAGSALQPVAQYEHDAQGRLVTVSDAAGFSDRFEYDAQHRVTREVAKDGGVFHFRYDAQGRCIQRTGLGHYDDKRLRYLDATRTTEVTDSHGAVWRYQASPTGQILNEWSPLGAHHGRSFDEHGRLVAKTDSAGAVTRYAYDAQGNRSLVIDALGHRSVYRYNDSHQPTLFVDALGQEWQRRYDARNRLVQTIDPLGASWQFGYDDDGDLVEIVNPVGARRLQVFSGAVLRSYRDWSGGIHSFEFDAFGRLVERRDPLGHTTRVRHDVLGRPVQIVHADESQILASYDPAGRLSSYVDGNGHVRRWKHGPCGRLLEVHDPLGHVTRYEWGSEPRELTAIVNAKGERYEFFRDEAGRVIRELAFDGGVRTFLYNGEDRPIGMTTANGEVIAVDRDACQRVIAQHLPDGETVQFAFDPLGRLAGAANADASLAVERDPAGRIVREVQGAHWVATRYDLAGAALEQTSSLGLRTEFERDGDQGLLRMSTGQGYIGFEYDAAGREVRRTLPGGVQLDQAYDALGRLRSQQVGSPATHNGGPQADFIRRLYHHDAAGQIAAIEDSHWGRTEYRYDPAERLIECITPAVASEWFAYDATDNLVRTRRTGALPRDETWDIGPGDRLLQQAHLSHRHDAEGRLVETIDLSDPQAPQAWRYEWDALDRLRVLRRPDGQVWRYTYDPLGRRTGKACVEGGTPQHIGFVWDRERMVHELSGGHLASTWLYEPGRLSPIATVQDGKTYSIVNDAAGTPRELLDAQGHVVLLLQRTAWGEQVWPAPGTAARVRCPMAFQGQWHDEESGLHYNKFRYHDPRTGRFISQDPIRLLGGLNLYAYCRNPVNWVDPLGLSCQSDSAKRGRDAAEADLKAAGHTILAEEVTMVVNGSRVRADFVTQDAAGNIHVIEVKNGTGRLTENQTNAGVFDMNNPGNSSPHPGGTIDTSGGTTTTFTTSTGNTAKTTDVGLPGKGSSGTATFTVLHYDE